MKPFSKFIFSLLIIIAFTVLSSCKPSGSVESGYEASPTVNIYLRYDAEEGALKSEIRYFRDTSLVESVEFEKPLKLNGKLLQQSKSSAMGIFYKLESKSLLSGTYIFSVGEHEIPVQLLSADSLHFEKPLSISESNRLVWTGEPLSEEETLAILIEDQAGVVHTFNRLGPSSYGSTLLHKEQMTALKPGKGKLSVVRKKTIPVSDGFSLEGIILTEYYAKPMELQILP